MCPSKRNTTNIYCHKLVFYSVHLHSNSFLFVFFTLGVAAPFTSRIPSVRAVVDLIRQGRCTLLSALMQQQIMMLESCIAAYTLSALSLHNARSSVRS